MGQKRWIAALGLLNDEIESASPRMIRVKLKNGIEVSVPIFIVDDEEVKEFSVSNVLKAYEKNTEK